MKGNRTTYLLTGVIVLLLAAFVAIPASKKIYIRMKSKVPRLTDEQAKANRQKIIHIRGVKNNNPGNIRIGSAAWQGKVPVSQNTDRAFEQFTSWVFGVRAMVKLLQSYIVKHNRRNIQEIVNRWAPPTENDTSNYVLKVEEWSGIPKLEEIKTTDKEKLRLITMAMVRMEVGGWVISDNEFDQAWKLI